MSLSDLINNKKTSIIVGGIGLITLLSSAACTIEKPTKGTILEKTHEAQIEETRWESWRVWKPVDVNPLYKVQVTYVTPEVFSFKIENCEKECKTNMLFVDEKTYYSFIVGDKFGYNGEKFSTEKPSRAKK